MNNHEVTGLVLLILAFVILCVITAVAFTKPGRDRQGGPFFFILVPLFITVLVTGTVYTLFGLRESNSQYERNCHKLHGTIQHGYCYKPGSEITVP